MRYGSLFIALSASLLWLAVVIGGAGLALLWPALRLTLVGAAYVARQPALLGKRIHGTRLRGEGAVYLHCASGHGRSATVAAALSLSRGLAASVNEAEAQLRHRRPGIRRNAAPRRSPEGMLAHVRLVLPDYEDKAA